jgi:hypothetical protein
MLGVNSQREEPKLELTEASRDYLISHLDKEYRGNTPLALAIKEFDIYDVSIQERNKMILESDYSLKEEIVSALTLFGF